MRGNIDSMEAVGEADDRVTSMPSPKPFRPIQYLGNKLRTLPAILNAADNLIGGSGRVADLFTGTTVVAQGFAQRGYQVSAIDAQQYSRVFAEALLGIGRKKGETCSFTELSKLGITSQIDEFHSHWKPLIEKEQAAIAQADPATLFVLDDNLPLIWRSEEHPLRQRVTNAPSQSAVGETPLLASVYAGTYFGARQAITIDEYRQNTELARAEGRISEWQYYAILTAIMSAASTAAHSAGKHFAQPLNAGSRLNERFLSGRLLQDRAIDIEHEFKLACNTIDKMAVPSDIGHHALCGTAENFVVNGERSDLYYLDPPYTAQQYSRFYHVLETICTYEYPQLFDGGSLTTGLYPANRYKSAFSSKRKTTPAFVTMIKAAHVRGAALAISYSQSSAASSGNARMISLEQLLELCSAVYGRENVDCSQLNHRYRQFNSSAASNTRRDDPEILIICKPR